ncbi:MAG: type IV pili methyl-accepting chemotaxis transducer N-terminal domain-containing protein [Pseudomonadota bacterium]
MYPSNVISRVVCATVLAFAVSGVPALGDTSNIEDIGATERINYAGKLRMLSQRMAAAACNLNARISPTDSRAILDAAGQEFATIADALEFGDPALGVIGEEKRRKTLVAIAALRQQLAPINTARVTLLHDPTDFDAIATIDSQNMELLSRAKLLVSEITSQYSDPTAVLFADALLIDIAGRQRMLTQKMSKEACLVWPHGTGETRQAQLSATMHLFEISLLSLRDGLAEAGVKPAPTPEIHAGLDAIWAEWSHLKPDLEQAVAGQNVPDAIRVKTFGALNVLLRDMNAVVGLYTEAGKTGL